MSTFPLRATCTLALAPLFVVAAAAQSPDEGVVRAMYTRWHGKTYATMTFRQETSFPDGRTEIWWESVRAPGMLRIDIAPRDSTVARVMLFRNDSIYQTRAGRPPAPGRKFVHSLMVLFTGVFWDNPSATSATLRELGFDLAKSHDDMWNGKSVTVVGAAAGDTLSPQFWVEKDRMIVVRIVEKGPQPTSPPRETRILAHELVGGSWVESDIQFFDGAKEVQRERYTEIRVNVPVDEAAFTPASGVVPSWIPRSGPGTISPGASAQGTRSPQEVVDQLLAADRAFSASGAGTDLVTSISAMLADDVIMPAPPGRLARGKADAVAALKANAANAQSTVTWAPLRGGIAADGLHGFTFGTMSVKRPDGTVNPAKYLSYWVKGAAGWRVAAYKRVPSGAGDAPSVLMAPSLPAQLVAPATNAATIEQHRASVIAAEKAFSDLAQTIGLGPAFREFGNADAINLGGQSSAGVVVGNEAIARLVQGDAPVTDGRVHWSADTAFVASSGDLGVTFGFITPNGEPGRGAAGAPGAPGGSTAGSPFFTIWRRAGPGAPWKYIAE